MISTVHVREFDTVKRACEENNLELGCTYMVRITEADEEKGCCIFDMIENAAKVRFLNFSDDETMDNTDLVMKAVMTRAEYANCEYLTFDESLKDVLDKLIKTHGYEEKTNIYEYLNN